MTIDFVCSACGHRMEISEIHAGRELSCTACNTAFVVPAAAVAGDGALALSCAACGAPSPAGATFCNGCGAALGVSVASDEALKRPGLITAIAVLDILGGSVNVLFALAALLSVGEDPVFGIAFALFYGLFGSASVAAGIGLWKLRPYGRTLQIALSIFGLIAIPIGTLISALILYYLYRPGIKILFLGKLAADLTPQERAGLAKVPGARATATAIIIAAVASVFFCGLISSIAIPSLLSAINRGRQERSIEDINTIATAIEAYRVDNGLYPAGLTSTHDLDELLTPTYLQMVPRVDGWRTPYAVWSSNDGTAYSIVSFGYDKSEGEQPGGATTDLYADIVLENGEFVQWPENIADQ